jgi:PhoH-like ATPase
VSEDYENDRALDDFQPAVHRRDRAAGGFLASARQGAQSWTDKGRTFYEIARRDEETGIPNQFLFLPGDDEAELKVARSPTAKVTLQIVDDYRHNQHACGASPRATASRTSRSTR